VLMCLLVTANETQKVRLTDDHLNIHVSRGHL